MCSTPQQEAHSPQQRLLLSSIQPCHPSDEEKITQMFYQIISELISILKKCMSILNQDVKNISCDSEALSQEDYHLWLNIASVILQCCNLKYADDDHAFLLESHLFSCLRSLMSGKILIYKYSDHRIFFFFVLVNEYKWCTQVNHSTYQNSKCFFVLLLKSLLFSLFLLLDH